MQISTPVNSFRHFLRHVTPLASRLHYYLMNELPCSSSVPESPTRNGIGSMDNATQELTDQIKEAVAELSEAHFLPYIALPSPESKEWSFISEPIYSLTLPGTPDLEACVFGFKHVGASIPLHDHSGMHAFMRVLRGRIRLASFSLYSAEELLRLGLAPTNEFVPARYEGVFEFTNGGGQVAALAPRRNNIHMVVAMEAGTALVDVFVPGYQDHNCNYYTLSQFGDQASFFGERTLDGLNVGQVCWLRRTGDPQNLRMQSL